MNQAESNIFYAISYLVTSDFNRPENCHTLLHAEPCKKYPDYRETVNYFKIAKEKLLP